MCLFYMVACVVLVIHAWVGCCNRLVLLFVLSNMARLYGALV